MTAAIVAAFAFVCVVVLTELIGAEVSGWIPIIARAVVRLSARQLPPDVQARYVEEWLHDVDALATDRKLSALVWSLRTCATAHGLRRDLRSDAAQSARRRRITYRDIQLFFMLQGVATIAVGFVSAVLKLTSHGLPATITWPLSGYAFSSWMIGQGMGMLIGIRWSHKRYNIPADAWLKVEFRIFPPRFKVRLMPPARLRRAASRSLT